MGVSEKEFRKLIETATSEQNTVEKLPEIFDICDRVKTSESAKHVARCLFERLNHASPIVNFQALVLLNACVSNCSSTFLEELAARDNVNKLTDFHKKAHPHIAEYFRGLLQKWCDNEFKSSSSASLSSMSGLLRSLRNQNFEFPSVKKVNETTLESLSKSAVLSTPKSSAAGKCNTRQQEEDDLAEAIRQSLAVTSTPMTTMGNQSAQPLYPSMGGLSTAPAPGYSAMGGFANDTYGTTPAAQTSAILPTLHKVRALYDFEAAEKDELTFKTGDIINVVDDSNSNWWRGNIAGGRDGLFPSNFVSSDLTDPQQEASKKVSFENAVEVKVFDEPSIETVTISEQKIDACLATLQNADVTVEDTADPPELRHLEEECRIMGTMIDDQLEHIDKRHLESCALNEEVMSVLKLYNTLMQDSARHSAAASTAVPSFPGAYGYGMQAPMAGPGGIMPPQQHLPGQFPGAAPEHQAPMPGYLPPAPPGSTHTGPVAPLPPPAQGVGSVNAVVPGQQPHFQAQPTTQPLPVGSQPPISYGLPAASGADPRFAAPGMYSASAAAPGAVTQAQQHPMTQQQQQPHAPFSSTAPLPGGVAPQPQSHAAPQQMVGGAPVPPSVQLPAAAGQPQPQAFQIPAAHQQPPPVQLPPAPESGAMPQLPMPQAGQQLTYPGAPLSHAHQTVGMVPQ